MRIVLQVIGIMFFTCFFYSCTSLEHQTLDYEQMADQITDKTAKKLQKKKRLFLVGTGGGMMNDIQMMSMSFFFYREISMEEARSLVVYSAKKYLKNINENEEIRPHLHDDPFTAKNIEIWLWVCNPDGSDLDSEKMSFILLANGKIAYCSDILGYYEPLHEETYEEALNIVNNAKTGLSKAS